jgi:hypothetical protein
VLVSREHQCPSPSQCQWSSASTFTLKGAACRPGQYHITVHTYGKREERFQLNVITGEWKDGSPLRNNGVWMAPARDGGHTFEGEWKQGRPYAGHGSWRNPDGHLFSGTWVVGMRQGHGEIHYKNGDLYVGNLADDLKHGKGVIRLGGGQGDRHCLGFAFLVLPVFPAFHLPCLPVFVFLLSSCIPSPPLVFRSFGFIH